MRPHTRLAIITALLFLAVSSLLAKRAADEVTLTVRSSANQESVSIRLVNKTAEQVELYDSLQADGRWTLPRLTSIRFRDARGVVASPVSTLPEGFWNPTLGSGQLDNLHALPSGAVMETSVALSDLLAKFPEPAILAQTTEVQVRCVVFFKMGLVEARSDWMPLPNLSQQP